VRIYHCNQTPSLQIRCGIAVFIFLAATGLINKSQHLQNESSFSHSPLAEAENPTNAGNTEKAPAQKFTAALSQKFPALRIEFPPTDSATNCTVTSTLFTTGMACSPQLAKQQDVGTLESSQGIAAVEIDEPVLEQQAAHQMNSDKAVVAEPSHLEDYDTYSEHNQADNIQAEHKITSANLDPIEPEIPSEKANSEHRQAHHFQTEQKIVHQAAASVKTITPLASKHFASRLKQNKFPYSFSDIKLSSLSTESDLISSAKKLSFVDPVVEPITDRKSARSGGKSRAIPRQGFLHPLEDSRLVIVIDPGHGGSDVGTTGPGGAYEKKITLDIAKRVQIMASLHEDIKVVLSRSMDGGMSRAGRIKAIQSEKPDFLLSLHLNNIPQKELVLVETYYSSTESSDKSAPLKHSHDHSHDSFMKVSDTDGTSSPRTAAEQKKQVEWSRRFATEIQSKVFAAVQSRNPRAIDAGVKDDEFYVLTRTGIPGALVEMTCLSNSDEEKRLGTESYRNELAVSLMAAIRSLADMHQSEGAI